MKRKRNESKENKNASDANVVKNCGQHVIKDTSKYRELLLKWYDANCRTLPWRTVAKQETDPNVRGYQVWVSEIMLQQTQVATVIEYYNKWMKKWPTVKHLAEASLDKVQEAWSGLGYYSRARRLHEAADHITNKLDGEMPRTSADLLKLPGVGRYTASAVASIAYNEVTGLVDGNVSRVLTRMTRVGADVTCPHVVQHTWNTADDLVDGERPGEFNQAMMELGAVICTPKSPSCQSCPVQSLCAAYSYTKSPQLTDIEDCDFCLKKQDYNSDLGVMNYPRKAKKTSSKDQETLVAVVKAQSESGNRYLMERRPNKGLLANLLQFPSVELEPNQEVKESDKIKILIKHLKEKNLSVSELTMTSSVSHIFSHINMTYSVYTVTIESFPEEASEMWLTEEQFQSCGTSTAMRKVFKSLNSQENNQKKSLKEKRKTDKNQPSLLAFFKAK